MHWLMLALGIGALAVAMKTSSMLLMGVCLLAALVFILMWVLGLYSARAGARSRDETEARKVAASQAEPPAQ